MGNALADSGMDDYRGVYQSPGVQIQELELTALNDFSAHKGTYGPQNCSLSKEKPCDSLLALTYGSVSLPLALSLYARLTSDDDSPSGLSEKREMVGELITRTLDLQRELDEHLAQCVEEPEECELDTCRRKLLCQKDDLKMLRRKLLAYRSALLLEHTDEGRGELGLTRPWVVTSAIVG